MKFSKLSLALLTVYLIIAMASCSNKTIESDAVKPVVAPTLKNDTNAITLSPIELDKINAYVQGMTTEEAVSQILMVNVPTYYKNYKDHPKQTPLLKEIIVDIGVGGVFMGPWNYNQKIRKSDPENQYINELIAYHNKLQSLAKDSKIKLPLLIAVDFEGPSNTSIPGGVIVPPEPLVLSASSNAKNIKVLGNIIGNQLNMLGINVILGPVLDVDSPPADAQKAISTLGNRAFASSPKLVYTYASHYIFGLRETSIAVFVKHFPSLGSTEGKLHDFNLKQYPTYNGSAESFKRDLVPYPNLNEIVDGLMTSHIKLSFLGNNSKIATFSETIVKGMVLGNEPVGLPDGSTINGMNYKEKIVITDDLSHMPAIYRYMQLDKEATYADVALEAFKAGHDILLFSSFSGDDFNRSNTQKPFTTKEIREIKIKLIEYVDGNENNQKRLRESVVKVIKLKSLVSKRKNMDLDKMLDRKRGVLWTEKQPIDIADIKRPSFNGLEVNAEDIIRNIVDESAIFISNKHFTDLSQMSDKDKILIYVPKKNVDIIKKEYGGNKNITIEEIPINTRYNNWFRTKSRELKNEIRTHDKIIYISDCTGDDANLLVDLVNRTGSESEKINIMLHCNPNSMPTSIYNGTNTISTFSKHPYSYETDLRILKGEVKPKGIETLPISIGKNASFYDINKQYKNDSINPAKDFKPIVYYATKKEEEQAKTIKELEKTMENNQKNELGKSEYVKMIIGSTGEMTLKMLFVILVLVMMMTLYYIPKDKISGGSIMNIVWYLVDNIKNRGTLKAVAIIIYLVFVVAVFTNSKEELKNLAVGIREIVK